jgi:ribonuclease P protein component
LLILLAPRVDGTETRLGLVASRKMGGAVQRNRAKRVVRESFRRNLSLFPACVDLVVIVRSGLDLLSQPDVEAEIVGVSSLLRKRASGKMATARPSKPRQ